MAGERKGGQKAMEEQDDQASLAQSGTVLEKG